MSEVRVRDIRAAAEDELATLLAETEHPTDAWESWRRRMAELDALELGGEA